eukprot:SAG31_NODE_3519_length_4165_cov_2.486227_4_plen_49_part_00
MEIADRRLLNGHSGLDSRVERLVLPQTALSPPSRPNATMNPPRGLARG